MIRFYIALAIILGLIFSHGYAWKSGDSHGQRFVQAQWDAERVALQAQAIKEANDRAQAAKEIQRETQRMLENAAANAATAQRNADRVRERAAKLAAMCQGGEATPAGPGLAASQAGSMLSGMLEGANKAATDLARYADALQSDLYACRSLYERQP